MADAANQFVETVVNGGLEALGEAAGDQIDAFVNADPDEVVDVFAAATGDAALGGASTRLVPRPPIGGGSRVRVATEAIDSLNTKTRLETDPPNTWRDSGGRLHDNATNEFVTDPNKPTRPRSTAQSSSGKGGAGPVAKGQEGVEIVKRDLLSEGRTIRGDEVTFDTKKGTTRLDIMTETRQGDLVGVECKTGPCAAVNKNQRGNFEQLETHGGIPRGQRAKDAGLEPGKPLAPFRVEVRRVDNERLEKERRNNGQP